MVDKDYCDVHYSALRLRLQIGCRGATGVVDIALDLQVFF